MAHDPETRQAARSAYVFQRMSLEGAADHLDIGVATVRRWRTQAAASGDDWDRARAAASLSSEGAGTIAQLVLSDFLTLYQATVADLRDNPEIPAMDRAEALSRLSDAFTKTMNAVAKASPDLARYAVATELLRDLAGFTREHYPEHVEAMLELLEPFATHVAKKYG
ncbi:DUF1804 family protein [uncultured Rhodospira sp.]|uniref:DUF1804 family protein n=1 Tax=uncultured Rhodospira sp. TaxID=1936189 RepID=UPI002619163D|nr:DUF1804 family protein [uncultured Rhodospira sp.]